MDPLPPLLEGHPLPDHVGARHTAGTSQHSLSMGCMLCALQATLGGVRQGSAIRALTMTTIFFACSRRDL